MIILLLQLITPTFLELAVCLAKERCSLGFREHVKNGCAIVRLIMPLQNTSGVSADASRPTTLSLAL